MADHDTHDHTGVPGVGGSVATDTIWDAAGDLVQGTGANTAAKLSAGASGKVLTAHGSSAALTWETPSSGGVSTVDQDISGDFTSGSGSTWSDITGLTGISLTAGTWIGYVDLELYVTTAMGPAFRIRDTTNSADLAQAGVLRNAPVANVSYHYCFNSKPFVLAGSATIVIQYYSDTVFAVKQYPTRGGLSTAVASHVTFLKVA